MVVVDLEVAFRLYGKVDKRMLLEKLKHVVEKPDASRYLSLAGTVEVQLKGNLRFLGVARYFSRSHGDIISNKPGVLQGRLSKATRLRRLRDVFADDVAFEVDGIADLL